jgi:hypothetical protein
MSDRPVHPDHEQAALTIRKAIWGDGAAEDAVDDLLAALAAAEKENERLNARWQEMSRPFDQSEYDAMYERAVAAEKERDDWKRRYEDGVFRWYEGDQLDAVQRAVTAETALREIDEESDYALDEFDARDYQDAAEAVRKIRLLAAAAEVPPVDEQEQT